LGYDLLIVLELWNKPASLPRPSLAGPVVYFDTNVLATLENARTSLDLQISETYEQIAEIAKLVLSADFGSTALNLGGLSEVRGAVASNWGSADRSEWANRPALLCPPQVKSNTLALTAWGSFQAPESRYQTVDGEELIDCRIVPALGSALNLPGYPPLSGSVVVSQFIFLPCFLLLRAVSDYEELRSLVIVAIVALLSWLLRSVGLRNSIAVCQRSFFIRHGAHPPENRSQCLLGSFSGREIQPQVT
jgi:hypothetical protein